MVVLFCPDTSWLYISLVQSQVLYCSPIWRPCLIKNINMLERIQRQATKWILNDYQLTYRCRLMSLHLLPLMYIYELNDVIFFIKSHKQPSSHFNVLSLVCTSIRLIRQIGLLYTYKFSWGIIITVLKPLKRVQRTDHEHIYYYKLQKVLLDQLVFAWIHQYPWRQSHVGVENSRFWLLKEKMSTGKNWSLSLAVQISCYGLL